MSQRKLFIVHNPFAGGKRKEKLVRNFAEYAEARETDFVVYDTQKSGNATRLISEELDSSYTDLIIIGGDGTINEAINGLKQDIPVSVIPAGTGNDFIKNISIGKNQQQHFETAIEGNVINIDVGKCNDRIFLNGIGIGFDGQIVEDMGSKRVPLLSGHAAYYYHVLRILGSYRERPFHYRLDEEKFEKDLILLTIGNGTTFGGGFKLMPEAKVDDGLLEICEIGTLSPLKRFLNIHRLSGGTHGSLNEVNFHRATRIHVEENPLLFAHIDGERLGSPPYEIEVMPGKLKIRVRNS
ncbi:MAG: diacylglycerol kinase family lipid kinase [Cyclobacteriaceae bacterium]